MNRKILLTAIVLVAVLLLVYFVFPFPKSDTSVLTTKVKKGTFEVLVYSSGQLETESSDHINIPEKLKDRQTMIYNLTITDLIEEGSYVDSGDYVATLDHQAVEEQLKNSIDELETALTEYNDSKIDSNLTLSNQRDLIVNADLDLEERRIAVEESVYESPSEQKKVKMDYDKALRKLEQTKKAYELKTQQEINKVKRKYINYRQIKERVEAQEELKNSLIIYSHRSGIISYYKQEWGGVTKTGSYVSMYNPVIATFPNMDSLITKTYINEIDIALIKQGQKVKIGIDAFPEKELTGEVSAVANMGQVMPNSDAKVFEVKIKVNGSDPDLKPAMTTSNTIQVNTLENAMYVPIESVFSNDSMAYVFPVGGKEIKQVVETGEENENFVVIQQGLEEGQEIYLLEPENSEEYAFAGMEIYEEIKQKEAKRKAKEEEERIKREQDQKAKNELPADVKLPSDVVIIKSN